MREKKLISILSFFDLIGASLAREACTNILDAKGEVRTAEAQFIGEISGLVSAAVAFEFLIRFLIYVSFSLPLY